MSHALVMPFTSVCVYIYTYATVSTGTRETAIPTPFYNSTIRPHFPIQTIPKILCCNSTIWPLTLTTYQNTKTITSIKYMYIHPAVCFLSPSFFLLFYKYKHLQSIQTHQRNIYMYILIPSNQSPKPKKKKKIIYSQILHTLCINRTETAMENV